VQERRLTSYRREARLLRRQRDEESQRERKSLSEAVQAWRALREARGQRESGLTDVKLVIRKESADLAADKVAWETEIGRELREARAGWDDASAAEEKAYQARLAAWKKTHSELFAFGANY